MKIHTTLEEVLDKCNNWDLFCEEKGFSIWAVNEGCGDVSVTLTLDEAIRYGIIHPQENENY